MPKRFKKTSGRLEQNIEAFLKNITIFLKNIIVFFIRQQNQDKTGCRKKWSVQLHPPPIFS